MSKLKNLREQRDVLGKEVSAAMKRTGEMKKTERDMSIKLYRLKADILENEAYTETLCKEANDVNVEIFKAEAELRKSKR